MSLADGHVTVALHSVGKADQARFSPDGRWIAYNEVESGREQVFVVPFPPSGERWQISPSGGVQPEWRADGRELFYLDTTNALMAVDIRSQPSFAAGPPRRLFQTPLLGSDENEEYRVTADGQRFLLRVPIGRPTPNHPRSQLAGASKEIAGRRLALTVEIAVGCAGATRGTILPFGCPSVDEHGWRLVDTRQAST